MAPLSSNLPNALPRISGYTLTEQLYKGTRTAVYRGVSAAQQPVVIKVMRQSHPDFDELVHFRNQYAITQNLPILGVVRPLSLEPWQNGYALVMKDFEGCSLQQYTAGQSLSLTEILGIALQMADILHGLNQHHVVHKDIKPANILIQPASKRIQLIDFSIATLLPKETQEIKNPNVLEGTLAYLAPEQTGRMNRGIDYRTDFYGLGVTLYKLLTGQVPFLATDPLELVHCHIAKAPIPAHEVNSAIPVMVSQIVFKLMAKNAEDRYQSALGLKHDLAHCLQVFKDTGKIAAFELGQRDVSDRFLIPDKLYGRESEVQQLLAAFERASQGKAEMMLVAGFSGIGKTAVVNEVHKPITRQHGYFIKGKFDQFNRNIPFSAFVQAFRNLMGQLLSESDQQLAQWKTQILAAVGDQGQVITEMIPELERIIDPQPAVAELSGSAAQNRFNLLFDKFVRVFASKEHPLVIFLDDLQWADSASLNLLKLLMNQSELGSESGYLLALGAYRDNEVFPAHPLMLTLNELHSQETTLNTLTLEPLGKTDLTQLVADTMMCQADIAAPLSQLIAQKTQGNPFFTTQFLTGLYEDGYIAFDAKLGYWQCDLSQVRQLALTDDVVVFMVGRLQKLPKMTQTMLKLAACIGNQFDLATLAIVCSLTQEDVASHLWDGLKEGLVIPENKTYKFFQGNNPVSHKRQDITVNYRFLHDRVQQAAYALIPEEQKQATHHRIGTLLHTNLSEDNKHKLIFDIVNHLNFSQSLLRDRAEVEQLANLNLLAGEKAISSTAYDAAIAYLQTGLGLLGESAWAKNYDLTLLLYKQLCSAQLSNGNYEQLHSTLAAAQPQVIAVADQVDFWVIQITSHSLQGQFEEAIRLGVAGFKALGTDLEANDIALLTRQEAAATKGALGSASVYDLLALPTTVSSLVSAEIKLGIILDPPAYITGDINLYSFTSLRAARLSIEHGNIPESVKAYANYGLLLGLTEGQYQKGYEFADMAFQLAQKFNHPAQQSKVGLLLGGWIQVWAKPIKGAAQINYDSFMAGMDAGETQFAAYNLFSNIFNRLFQGEYLESIKADIEKFFLVAHKIDDALLKTSLAGAQIVVKTLIAGQSDVQQLSDSLSEAKEIIHFGERTKVSMGIGLYYASEMHRACIMGDFQHGLDMVHKLETVLDAIAGFTTYSYIFYYSSLILLQSDTVSVESRAQCLERVESNQKQLKLWANSCPENFLHKYLLVEAERLRYIGKKPEAIDSYNQAIAGAKENGYCQEEALANELAAKYYLSRHDENIAANYLQKAYYGYARWGAKAKTDNLVQRYPMLLQPILQQVAQSAETFNPLETIIASQVSIHASTHASPQTTRTSTTNINTSLDLAAVLKASQALSGTIELEDLLRQLTQIILQNSGGDHCALILADPSGTWQLKALATADNTDLCTEPLSDHPKLPLKLIQYVKNTQDTVVIDNLETELPVIDDYLEKSHPQSLLCLPLLNQGKLLGILYLRNRATRRAFTRERIHILGFLCTQAAISLENARLYQQAQTYAEQLEQSQLQTVQTEKMASLGNLVAGVAHEINNPIGFLNGSIKNAQTYLQDLSEYLALYQQHHPQAAEPVQEKAEDIDLDFLLEDFPKLLNSMTAANQRIKSISTSLRTFSRADTEHKVSANLHEGLDSTLLILKYRLKGNENRPEIKVVKDYGELPAVDCFPGQLNQVFMNLLANAIDIFDEAAEQSSFAALKDTPQIITVKTEMGAEQNTERKTVNICIGDNGKGIPEAVKARIFDHLYTTKGVGKGTGLGLAIAQQIVVEKHGGRLTVQSELGQGTEFCIQLPF